MESDGPILYQSTRIETYRQIVSQLIEDGYAYPCACTRKDLPASGKYPGTCRNGITGNRQARSVRFCVEGMQHRFTDKLQGLISGSANDNSGDFVIQRSDGLFAYQLAVVVDDNFQGITQVVRGADLLDSTPRQIGLQHALGYTTPDYVHLPLVLSDDGKKLAKRLKADPVRHKDPRVVIGHALQFLGQQPPTGLSLDKLWQWAIEHWDRNLVRACKANVPQPIWKSV